MIRPFALGLVGLACLAAGCASHAVPRPFPGAAAPPQAARPPAVATEPPEAPTSRAGGAPPPAADGLPAAPAMLPLLATALTLKGVPYRNGGTTPSGFDCSGFVRYVFAQHGQALPREVQDQFKVGTPIDREAVRPGDLVFFETVSRGASHVGIALGDGEFVHAPSSRGVVRVERYTTAYWAKRWVGARRLGGSDESDATRRARGPCERVAGTCAEGTPASPDHPR